jgi:hypothetical protein
MRTLADEYARHIVANFRVTTESVATFDDLVEDIASQAWSPGDRERVAIRLHHMTLPKLSDNGLIEYDPRSQTVEYLDKPALGYTIEMVESAKVPSLDVDDA